MSDHQKFMRRVMSNIDGEKDAEINRLRDALTRIVDTTDDLAAEHIAKSALSLQCSHAPIFGTYGKWHCQKCGQEIEMAYALSSHPTTPNR